MQATLDRDAEGNIMRKAGVMGVVVAGGDVLPTLRSRYECRKGRCPHWRPYDIRLPYSAA
jgi:hypothetical protein